MSSALEVRQLRKSYGKILAVADFSQSFPPGKITAVVGPSGSGKTTVLSMIAGLVQPDAGSILLDGQDLSGSPAESRDFGMVFQDYLLFPHLTVRENVEFGLRVRKVARGERRRKASEVLEKLGLGPLSERRVQAISGGEAQRVALGRALAFGPRVLLLDEPFSALDARLRESLRSELRRLLLSLQITTVYVTHDQADALSLADELIVVQGGQHEQAGSPFAVYSMPRNPFVASFLGAANVLRGECRDREGVREVQVSFASFPVPSESPRGPCWVILRPEDLGIAIGKEAHFEAKVDGTAFMGASLRLQVQSSGERLALDVPNETGIQPGTVVRLRIHTHKVVVIPAGDHAHPHPLSPRSAAGPPQ